MEYTKVNQNIRNVVNQQVKKLERLFPSVVKDGEVDFQALREELGQFDETDSEKYELTWAGKKNAKRIAQEDIVGKTLKFIPEDSKNADTTENIYIEGDNLEVLKLLRQNYYGAIKMIYIDPPYNTGNDFVYNDSFVIDKVKSDIAEGARSESGEQYVINKMSQNRFHANWLNMIYPRLKIAKDLLADNGFIFISIGEEELDNLKKICDEIFGESNFRNIISSRRYDKNINLQFIDEGLSTMNVGLEYILIYSKNATTKMKAVYKASNEERAKGGYWKGFWNNADRPTMRYDLFGVTPSEGQWKWKEEVAREAVENYKQYEEQYSGKMTLEEYWKKEGGNKRFLRRNQNGRGKNRGVEHWVAPAEGILRNSNWSDILISKPTGVDVPFDSPKNPEMLMLLCELSDCHGDVILDFFSGSSSMADAVLRYNFENGSNNKFIMVQLPEVTDEKSEAYKKGYTTICEIARERIRRVGDKIKKDDSNVNLDIGFKVFRTDNTNIKWNSLMNAGQLNLSQIECTPDLVDFLPEANDIDIVYELMLRQRDVALSETLEQLSDIGGRTYLYASSYLVCLETEITVEIVNKLAELDPLPMKFIFRDSAFKDDIALKDETFRRLKALIDKNTSGYKSSYTIEFL